MEEEPFLIRPEVKSYIEELIKSMNIVEYKISIESGSVKGDNYLGVIAKVTVNGKKDEKPISLYWIAKNAPQSKSFRELVAIRDIYEREIYVYQNLFPIFEKFQKERNVPEPFANYPQIIGTYHVAFQEAVIMEDMKRKHFDLRNRKESLDLEHVKLVMKIYGKFHAISYAIRDQEPDLFSIIKKNMAEQFITSLPKELSPKQDEIYCATSLSALDPIKYDRHRKVFGKYMERSFEYVIDSVKKSQEDPYSVVNHGDSWINNILFQYGDKTQPNIPTEICLLDFQLSRCGSPACDLSYFIFTCTEKSLRDEHFETLITTYYESLSTHLRNLGSSPEKMLPFHVLQQHLKRYSIVGYFLAQIVLHLMISDPEEVPDFSKEMKHEEYLNSFTYESKNEEFYKRRISGILVDFVEKGYFDFIDEEY